MQEVVKRDWVLEPSSLAYVLRLVDSTATNCFDAKGVECQIFVSVTLKRYLKRKILWLACDVFLYLEFRNVADFKTN